MTLLRLILQHAIWGYIPYVVFDQMTKKKCCNTQDDNFKLTSTPGVAFDRVMVKIKSSTWALHDMQFEGIFNVLHLIKQHNKRMLHTLDENFGFIPRVVFEIVMIENKAALECNLRIYSMCCIWSNDRIKMLLQCTRWQFQVLFQVLYLIFDRRIILYLEYMMIIFSYIFQVLHLMR